MVKRVWLDVELSALNGSAMKSQGNIRFHYRSLTGKFKDINTT